MSCQDARRHTASAREYLRRAGPLRTTALSLGAAVLVVACEHAPARAPRTVVRLTGDVRLSEALAKEYARRLPEVDVRVVQTTGSPGAVSALVRGEADLAFSTADTTYFAYADSVVRNDRLSRQLRGVSVLNVAPLHLLVAANSGIHDLADLTGHRVRLGSNPLPVLTGTLILRAFGVDPGLLSVQPLSADDAAAHLGGGLDAMFFQSNFSRAFVSTAMRRGAYLLPIEGPGVERLRREYPFVRVVSIPAGTYPGQRSAIRTVGIDMLFICRSDLREHLVYDLTKAFFDALPHLSSLMASADSFDPYQAPATPIPLHEGAAHYYREWELFR